MNAPRLPGRTGVNKTIHRPITQCRIVITLEVELGADLLRTQPNWRRTAVDYFRFIGPPMLTWRQLINTIVKRKDIKVLSEKVEVAP